MSLQVWLPLNGNLNNQGLSEVTVTNSGATVSTSGKIGSCYSFDTGKYLTVTRPSVLTKEISYSCWVNLYSWNSATYDCILSIATGPAWNDSRATLCRNGSSTNLTWNIADGSSRSYVNSNTSLSLNTWYHIACTYDGAKLRIYINGVEDNSASTSLTPNYSSANLRIGSWSGDNYNLKGFLNDVRVYNHCLSAKEVKEISKGLLCHYKLDNNGFGGENLILESHRVISGGGASGITSTYMDDGSLKVVSTSGNGNYRSCGFSKDSNSNVGSKLSVGDTYTISLDVKVEEGSSLPTLFINGGNGYKALHPVNGKITTNNWFRAYYTSTWNEPGTSYGNISLHLGFSSAIGTFYFKNFKLEKGSKPTQWCPSPLDDNKLGLDSTTESDYSGYSYNGILSESLPYASDSPRYDGCYYFNSTSKRITLPAINMSGFSNSFSIAWWGKAPSYSSLMYWGFSDGNRLNFYSGMYCNTGDGSSNPYYKPNTTTTISTPSVDTWHHFVMVGDGSSNKLYMDGELYGVAKTYKGITGSSIVINGWDSSTQYKTNGYISDFRIYSTALSASDIKELYNISASVDKNGNMYAYEFKEE